MVLAYRLYDLPLTGAASHARITYGPVVERKDKTEVSSYHFISHSVFYWKIHLVLDRDTFRLELDYRSIMHIKVKVPSN